MLYVTCSMIPSVDLTNNGLSRAKYLDNWGRAVKFAGNNSK